MIDSNKYDVAIIGGGLAGLTLSIQCADAGYKTILFEKENYPFHKVCGEYISMEGWNFLERLGLPLQNFHLPFIKKLQLTDNAGRAYSFKLPLGGFGISRYKLDNALFEIAKAKGVDVHTETKVSDVVFENDLFVVQTNSNNYAVRVAAGAYGKRSNMDIKWKRDFIAEKKYSVNNYIGVKYHIRYEQPKELITLHNFKNGYCGISNIEDSKCCLCYLTTSENLKMNNNSIEQMEKNILCTNPKLKEIFSSAEFLYKEPLAISQISFDKKSQVENHLLMIGDAAGMITPLCGNGMSMAMHGSKIAFSNINDFLLGKNSRNKMEQAYTMQWQKVFKQRLWVGRNVQRLFGNNSSTAFFLSMMNALPFVSKKIIKATHGEPF